MRTRTTSTPSPGDPAHMIHVDDMSSEVSEIEALQSQADRCRRLAIGVGDRLTVERLIAMAREYEARAAGAKTSH